ncbi:MAG: hypothetical protein L3J08_09555 [Flavobacteriaceae bacterium]|nr:hypothetical protein [Flavobacteriaceae bacterium]
MILFEANIDDNVVTFLQEHKKMFSNLTKVNALLKKTCGINQFFNNQNEILELKNKIEDNFSIVQEPNRRAYGDYQTNENLSSQVTQYISSKQTNFEFILEPTCGKGNFIIASLEQFDTIKRIVGVEIYLPYVWETKFKILSHFINNNKKDKPNIDIFHENAFVFPYKEIAKKTKLLKTLIIGNPPWVTNSELGAIDSDNLPKKSNFKKHSGFDAITGKGNFDIGEYISIIMLNCFHKHNGIFSFLIKNSVVKNIISDQKNNNFRITNSEKLNIDSKKEFNVSVNASLFITELNQEPELTCTEYDFYSHKQITRFGWHKNKFVNSIEDYHLSSSIDGKSFFTWRSGIKHDCSKIMEFEPSNGHFINGYNIDLNLENDLVYGLLKSSDLKERETNQFRKLTIITQRKIGQETKYIEWKYPLTYKYLKTNREFFDKRKSSIYKGKPSFSIFGVGDYSFKPYKVAISGMYKTTHFTLVSTDSNNKPIMLDDTCYFIGFDDLNNAKIAHYLVNSELVQQFLKSIIFTDSKRSINKDILMRIDFEEIYNQTEFTLVESIISGITIDDWVCFGELVTKANISEQMTLF